MTPKSAAGTEVARALWARVADGASGPDEVAAAAERMCTLLSSGLTRWVGAAGYRAVFERALGLVRPDHPALGSLPCIVGDEPRASAAGRHSTAAEVSAGMVALITTVVDVLGRAIGDEMAVRLVEQAGLPGPRLVVSADRKRRA